MTTYLLGLDAGSTLIKAALFDTQGNEHCVAARKVEHVFPQPDWVEADMTAIWNATAEVIAEVIQRSGVTPSDIAAVCCTGHGNGLYLVDHQGQPARPAIRSPDMRARTYVEQWAEARLLDRIRDKTAQAIWPLQPNALLRWMKDHEPETLARAQWFFCCKDYLRFCLTGEAYMELTDMSGTSLINVVTGQYDDDVLDTWGIGDLREILPPLRRSADLCGTVTAETAAATGLAEGTPVAGGLFDIDACGLSVGMTDPSQLCIIAGTWGNNQYISREPVISENVFMTSRYAIDGYYLILEGSSTSASNLEWFVSEFFQADARLLEQSGEGQSVFALCDELVAATSPEEAGIVFLPFLTGSNVSLDGKACFFGLDGRHGRGHVLRAIFEGIIFSHMWHVDRLLQFRERPRTIRLTGGAARSDVWAQMFADAFQVPVEIPEGSELGALGAAICAAHAVGIYDSFETACGAMVHVHRRFEPDAAAGAVYQNKYDRYRRLLDALAPVWSELAWVPSR